MKTILAFLTLATAVQAADVHLRNGITAYEAVVTEPLPTSVMALTDSDYQQWATEANRRALAGRPPQHDRIRYAQVTEQSGWSQTRFGGGVGYGGYGGYAGYPGVADQQTTGSQRPGNSTQSSYGSVSKSYSMEYHDWPGFRGGGVTLLNPWARPRR